MMGEDKSELLAFNFTDAADKLVAANEVFKCGAYVDTVNKHMYSCLGSLYCPLTGTVVVTFNSMVMGVSIALPYDELVKLRSEGKFIRVATSVSAIEDFPPASVLKSAYDMGIKARESGDGISTCPFIHGENTGIVNKVLADQWIEGYVFQLKFIFLGANDCHD